MTLTMAWVRTVPPSAATNDVSGGDSGPSLTDTGASNDLANAARQELVIAADSRLRGGYAWDAAPKILRLPRGDAVLAFAGETDFAYPFMLQAWNAVDAWTPSRDRQQHLAVLKGHLVRVFNGMLNEISDLPRFEQAVDPDTVLLLAGFCWHEQRFRIWTLHYDKALRGFTFRPATPWRGTSTHGKVLAIAGDEVAEAKARLVSLLREQRRLTVGGFDLQPLDVLESMIEDPNLPTIGGPLQMAKVYRSLKTVAFVVGTSDDRPTLLGRPLLPYEKADRHPVLRR